jgi:predicted short-subunit dehydrogenase-like oxidoreductase (DUF2520 family)
MASRWLIAVRDDALEEVARELTRAGACRGVALHTSGVHGPEALAPLAEAGVSCGALHPLQTVATPQQGVRALRGSAFGLTAEGAAAEWAEEIVRLAGGWILRIPAGRRAEYHAAAALASNCLLAPLDAAVWLMGAVGVPEQDALRALAPIVRASCENGLALGPAAALTGPIRRGDVETVALHLRALAGGWILRIPAGRRAEYHAAAALASNCLLAPLDAAVWLMGAVGVPEQDALRALAPIVRASCENGLALGPAAALTGPIRRGDVETVALHLRALAGAPADVREIYRACSFHLIALARRAGLPEECARSLERLLAQGESNDA